MQQSRCFLNQYAICPTLLPCKNQVREDIAAYWFPNLRPGFSIGYKTLFCFKRHGQLTDDVRSHGIVRVPASTLPGRGGKHGKEQVPTAVQSTVCSTVRHPLRIQPTQELTTSPRLAASAVRARLGTNGAPIKQPNKPNEAPRHLIDSFLPAPLQTNLDGRRGYVRLSSVRHSSRRPPRVLTSMFSHSTEIIQKRCCLPLTARTKNTPFCRCRPHQAAPHRLRSVLSVDLSEKRPK